MKAQSFKEVVDLCFEDPQMGVKDRTSFRAGAIVGLSVVCRAIVVSAYVHRGLEMPDQQRVTNMLKLAGLEDFIDMTPLRIIASLGGVLEKEFPLA